MAGEEDEKKLDPVAQFLLDALAASDRPLSPPQIAKAYADTRAKPTDPADLWRKYLPAIRQQALFLARRGDIEIQRKGVPVDLEKPIKGLVKYALA